MTLRAKFRNWSQRISGWLQKMESISEDSDHQTAFRRRRIRTDLKVISMMKAATGHESNGAFEAAIEKYFEILQIEGVAEENIVNCTIKAIERNRDRLYRQHDLQAVKRINLKLHSYRSHDSSEPANPSSGLS